MNGKDFILSNPVNLNQKHKSLAMICNILQKLNKKHIYLVILVLCYGCTPDNKPDLDASSDYHNTFTKNSKIKEDQNEIDSLVNMLYLEYDETFLFAIANDPEMKKMITYYKDTPIWEIDIIVNRDSIHKDILDELKQNIDSDSIKEKYDYYKYWCYAHDYILNAIEKYHPNSVYGPHHVLFEVEETKFLVKKYSHAAKWESFSYSEVSLVLFDFANYMMTLNEEKRELIYKKILHFITKNQ